ncbi:GumC family protein [Stakelama tenebrarum]|uniref:non-specific protein-tyrosine kinase n=1 Tax=Stakelama tenebrarum TaxID=2711215 RepID=A0A6G6Y4J2_9SPHN|nr:polysaccharide biosynthesis tyrosine autokinase [Sphingosinithalassobacter tenebrarum]QIG79523.1 polysaccharide biosynthesis tyrosine autokinase [Sphingosinithalassobacter tenebrarum]
MRDTIRRRWWVMALIAAAVFVAGAIYVYSLTPRYYSQARVRIDPSRDPLAASEKSERATLSDEAIQTEVSSFYSLNLGRSVVRELGLVDDPDFYSPPKEDGPQMTAEEREIAVANAVLGKLGVYREGQTYILGVGFESVDPVKAARIANAFASNYIQGEVGDRTAVAARQAQWFRQRIAELSAEVRAADAEVARFRAEHGLLQGNTEGFSAGTVTDQQVAPLAGSLAQAESEAAQARAELAAARRQMARRDWGAISGVLQSGVIATLRAQRAEVVRHISEVTARYGDRYVDTIQAREQLEQIDEQILQEARRIVGSLESRAAAAQARVDSLRSSLGQLESERAEDTRASVIAESLEREAEAKRALYEHTIEQSMASTQAAQNQMSAAAIVDRAEPPSQPSFPNKPLFLMLALFAGIAAGGGVIAFQEIMSVGMRSAEEIEDLLGLPILAAIPRVNDPNPADQLIEAPTSFFSESYRIARAALLTGQNESEAQVIAISSAIPGEGKTTTALAFARTLANAGSRTLLLECDIRRAALSQLVPLRKGIPGTVEILRQEATVDEAIQPSNFELLDHLLVREPYYTSENLFGGGRMQQLLAEVRKRYDHIVLDLPPLVGLADGRFIAAMADVNVMVIKWNDTPAKLARQAVATVRSDGANVGGAIVTMVDSSAEMVGGHYYLQRYSAYYQQKGE